MQLPPVDHVVTGTELDSQQLLTLTVARETGKPLGLALSQFVNKSPIITSVEAGSPTDLAGLKANDLVVEINSKATSGESSKKVADWIKGSGNTIEFIVSREKKG